MKISHCIAFFVVAPAVGLYCYVTPWTRHAPGFDKAAFRRLEPGVPAATVLSTVGNPLYAWIYDSATHRNEPLTPSNGERILRVDELMAVSGMDKVTIFYSTSRFWWLSYESRFVVLTNGLVSGKHVVVQD